MFGKSSGQLPVHWAAESGSVACLNILLDASPLSLLSGDERAATIADVAEKNFQFAVQDEVAKRMEEDDWVFVEIKEEMVASKVL